MLADLLLEARPRYHVTGGHGVFWARMPYKNHDLGAGAHVTRFISLAEVGCFSVNAQWIPIAAPCRLSQQEVQS